MTSLIGDSNNLFSNHMVDFKKEGSSNEENAVHSLFSSSSTTNGSSPGQEDDNKITINLFDEHASYPCAASSPPANSIDEPSEENSTTTISELMGLNNNHGENTDGSEDKDEKPCSADITSFISKIHQQIILQQQQIANGELMNGADGEGKASPMANYSPWMRNAGRKKSHPVWEFFKDLKEKNGAGGVVCLYCDWSCDDRSPNNLRTHLKKSHSEDGIFAKFSEKLAQTPTQPYVKRVRAGGSMNASGSSQQQPRKSFSPATTISDNTFSLALQQLSSANLAGMTNSLNFLENIPKSTEIINIPVGFGTATATSNGVDEDEQHENGEAGSSSVSASDERAASGSPLPVEDHQTAGSGGSPSVTSTNHLSAFMNMAANPLMWNAMLSGANSTSGTGPNSGSAFSLNDGACLTVLMKMAIDLELTLSYHKRRSDIELCFESNRTAEKSGGRGKVLCLSDVGREIRVTERVNGAATDSEMWTKTDFNQFHWAIRGKCQKLLVKQ